MLGSSVRRAAVDIGPDTGASFAACAPFKVHNAAVHERSDVSPIRNERAAAKRIACPALLRDVTRWQRQAAAPAIDRRPRRQVAASVRREARQARMTCSAIAAESPPPIEPGRRIRKSGNGADRAKRRPQWLVRDTRRPAAEPLARANCRRYDSSHCDWRVRIRHGHARTQPRPRGADDPPARADLAPGTRCRQKRLQMPGKTGVAQNVACTKNRQIA